MGVNPPWAKEANMPPLLQPLKWASSSLWHHGVAGQPSPPAAKAPRSRAGGTGTEEGGPGVGTPGEGQQAPEVNIIQTLPQTFWQLGLMPQCSRTCSREQASCKPAKMFVGAEACINILFNQGLWANTVYSGSVQREQLRPCGAGAGDAKQQWQSDLPWHCTSPGVLSTIAVMAAGTGSPKTRAFPVPQLCSRGKLFPSCRWLWPHPEGQSRW